MRQWMFGGVYGTVLASALLAALHSEGDRYTPYYDAAWILVTAATAALVHGYAHYMSAHEPSGAHPWRRLTRELADEWPLVVACLPTVLLLCVAGLAGWPEESVTTVGLAINIALLAVWGTFAALRVGYRRWTAVLLGAVDAAVGLGIAVANALIK
ncbi:hypothetical protein [Streptomyces purpureus]|uniref:hypothetical protein n=1 Tax=Streptomyces purpureus TaxID=1951 RepID=UPI000376372F|nr:hypothetical protein [Streptomyces purpureus]